MKRSIQEELQPGRTVRAGADVEYFPGFLDAIWGNELLTTLLTEVSWHQPVVKLYGRAFHSPRLAAWYGDRGAVYQYSGFINAPLPWLPQLTKLRESIKHQLGYSFNCVLLNLYRDGADSMGWHRDCEPELGKNPVIASISLGEARPFLLRHRRRPELPTFKLYPDHGSLLVMSGTTQNYWRHSVPKISKRALPRLNLTFRHISFQPTSD